MNREQARALLEVATLKQPDDFDSDMQDALKFAANDPELLSWYEKRKSFDRMVSSAITEVPVPVDFRSKLVHAMRQSSPRRTNTTWRWLAAAAVIALLAGVTAMWSLRDNGGHWEDEALTLVNEVDGGRMPLDHWDGNRSAIQSWLAERKSPAPNSLPQGMSVLASLGCKIVKVAGHPASIMCFGMPGSNEEAHLVVVDIPNASASAPVFHSKNGWNMVTWNENGHSLMLATRADTAELRKLMA